MDYITKQIPTNYTNNSNFSVDVHYEAPAIISGYQVLSYGLGAQMVSSNYTADSASTSNN